jgi:hypothetical protein
MPKTCTPGMPGTEVCNGIDDNCNGQVDEGLGTSTCGVGACQRTVANCVNGVTQTCVPGTPSPEVCDGFDNNCNGQIDEGLGTTTCGKGVCTRTVNNCVNGVPQACVPGTPTVEVCDGLDNDCDGVIDNGNPGGGGSCATGLPGICAAGSFLCTAGALVCHQNLMAATEVCNGLDDNCNGTVDEGNPGGGVACSTGQLGICAAGTTACSGGAISCVRNQGPTTEVCNGLDDDCNGVVDNGFNLSTDVNNCGMCNHVCSTQHATSACSGGGCIIQSCSGNFVDVDGVYSNGCECADDPTEATAGNGDTCGAVVVLSTLDEGGSQSVTGKIATSGDEDWYQVQFNDNADVSGSCDPFRPNITFSSNPGGEFAFQMYTTACAGNAPCGTANLTSFDYFSGTTGGNASGTPTNDCCVTFNSGNVATNTCANQTQTLRIRVVRASGNPTCDSYTLLIKNGP